MAHIDYYLATISPNVYFAGTRPAEIAAKHGATMTYRPVNLPAVFSRTGGLAVPDRHPSRQAYRLQELARWGRALDLPLNVKPAHFPTNPAPSSYAVIAAQNTGDGDVGALVLAIARACWAEERDIAEDAVIRDCLQATGFEPSLVDSGLLSGAETFERNTEEAIAAGVFGVPFFVTDDGARFWGQDRLAMLDAHLSGTL